MKKKELIEALAKEQMTGWVYTTWNVQRYRFWCSCGYVILMDSKMNDWKYCPVCGATKQKKRGEKNAR